MFLNAVAVFAILVAIWWGYVVISESAKMSPVVMAFGGDAAAGSELRKCVVVIVIAAFWLIFG